MQGQSRSTEEKLRGFGAFFTHQLSVVQAISRKQRLSRPYLHFDLNAGCGHNHKVNVIGSPLLFREVANVTSLRCVQFCVELNKDSAIELAARTRSDPDTFVIHGDNREFTQAIPHIVAQYDRPEFALGSILVDPNNQRRDAIPYDALREVAKACPRLDIAFNFPSNQIKRIRGALKKGVRFGEDVLADCISMDELPEVLGKRHLQVRERVGEFTLVVGRNTPLGDWKSMGFHAWDSERGKAIRALSQMSRKEFEQLGQGVLWPDIDDTTNTCERPHSEVSVRT